jgi:hypothetical protein
VASSKLMRIEKRKRMEALFDKGAYVYFTATEDGTPIVRESEEQVEPGDMKIWVRPANPLQREMVVREAQAARARALVSSKDPDSKEWIGVRAFVVQLSQESLVDYVIDLDESDRVSEARRDVLKEPEWEDFNALRDAMRQYEEAGSPKDDPEWTSLLKRDEEFGRQVAERARELRESANEAMLHMPRVDEDDHNELYYESPDEMREQPQELQDALSLRLAQFVADAGEAKNSQGAAPSSTSSEPPAEPEISESSTPEGSSE